MTLLAPLSVPATCTRMPVCWRLCGDASAIDAEAAALNGREEWRCDLVAGGHGSWGGRRLFCYTTGRVTRRRAARRNGGTFTMRGREGRMAWTFLPHGGARARHHFWLSTRIWRITRRLACNPPSRVPAISVRAAHTCRTFYWALRYNACHHTATTLLGAWAGLGGHGEQAGGLRRILVAFTKQMPAWLQNCLPLAARR